MDYSKNGLQLTEQFEACRLEAYQDGAGIWTIGYGHTGADVQAGMVITQDIAERLLLGDVWFAASCVNRVVKVALTQGEFDALVDFVFNVGIGNFSHSTMLDYLNQGNYAAAADQFARWDKSGGVEVAGLLRRRMAEQKEFQS